MAKMRKAAGVLARCGIPLAANEVDYSRTHRAPETDGVLDACRQLGVTLVTYRPLAGGAVSANSPKRQDPAGFGGTLQEVAASREATTLQVALEWLVKRDEPDDTASKYSCGCLIQSDLRDLAR